MDAWILVAILSCVMALIAGVTAATHFRNLADSIGSLARSLGDGCVVGIDVAMVEAKLSRTDLETKIYQTIKEHPDMKNTSREDVRNAIKAWAIVTRDYSTADCVAQQRVISDYGATINP